MKAILMIIKPQHSYNILNLIKLWEIRKRFPSDYVGWVYIYCTKGKLLAKENNGRFVIEDKNTIINERFALNGKVVARFWCDKVEEIKSCQVPFTFDQTIRDFYTDTFNDMDDLLKASCLDYYSLEQYLKYGKSGYAIHVAKVKPFDKPKEISEFETRHWNSKNPFERDNVYELTRAPQSWCYIEV